MPRIVKSQARYLDTVGMVQLLDDLKLSVGILRVLVDLLNGHDARRIVDETGLIDNPESALSDNLHPGELGRDVGELPLLILQLLLGLLTVLLLGVEQQWFLGLQIRVDFHLFVVPFRLISLPFPSVHQYLLLRHRPFKLLT